MYCYCSTHAFYEENAFWMINAYKQVLHGLRDSKIAASINMDCFQNLKSKIKLAKYIKVKMATRS